MLDFVKINLLVPFKYNPENFVKLMVPIEDKSAIGKSDSVKEKQTFDQKTWFDYCFFWQPIPQSSQLEGSPLMDKESHSYIKRIELSQVQRKAIGLHHNESKQYLLEKENVKFQIGKIKLMFFGFGIGFIVFEVSAQKLIAEQLLDFNAALHAISWSSKFTYEQSIDKAQKKIVKLSLKEVVKKILDLQEYIPLRPYGNTGIKQCYSLVYCTGEVLGENKERFLESLRRGFKSGRNVIVDKNNIFEPFGYITWAVGEEILACFGDAAICGDANIKFITDSKDGLCKSISENYLAIYAYLIAVQLLVNDINKVRVLDKEHRGENIICRLTIDSLSTQEHINKLFKKYLCERAWDLERQINNIRAEYRRFDRVIASKELGQRLENIDIAVKDLQEKTDEILDNTRYLVDFSKNELKDFLTKERAKLHVDDLNEENMEGAIGQFIRHSSDYIERKVGNASSRVHSEEERLRKLLGPTWIVIMPTTKISLASAGVLWESCLEIDDSINFDYSGVCICTTAALEAELQRIFFDGLIQYMILHYGRPCNANADDIYKNWPEQLLSISKYNFKRAACPELKPQHNFTMGQLPFLLGKPEKNHRRNNQQLDQSKLMAKRMEEYLATILKKQYAQDPLAAFTKSFDNGPAFVEKSEGVRKKYRNPAAHVEVMSRDQAEGCLRQVIGKAEAYEHNARVTGVLRELFSRLDVDKLNS